MARTNIARKLRQDRVPAEVELWKMLRDRRLEGFKFRRQVPIGRYFADFVCMEARLIVELDGASHQDREAYDVRRTEDLERLGYVVVRVGNHALRETRHGVSLAIIDALMLATGGQRP